jgi:hypothetical protein
MENLKEDYREGESLLQYAVVRLFLDVPSCSAIVLMTS